MAAKTPTPTENFIETHDGWRLAAYRYPRKTKRAPVLLIHGLGTNRYDVDFPEERLSLAKYLYRKGFDRAKFSGRYIRRMEISTIDRDENRGSLAPIVEIQS